MKLNRLAFALVFCLICTPAFAAVVTYLIETPGVV